MTSSADRKILPSTGAHSTAATITALGSAQPDTKQVHSTPTITTALPISSDDEKERFKKLDAKDITTMTLEELEFYLPRAEKLLPGVKAGTSEDGLEFTDTALTRWSRVETGTTLLKTLKRGKEMADALAASKADEENRKARIVARKAREDAELEAIMKLSLETAQAEAEKKSTPNIEPTLTVAATVTAANSQTAALQNSTTHVASSAEPSAAPLSVKAASATIASTDSKSIGTIGNKNSSTNIDADGDGESEEWVNVSEPTPSQSAAPVSASSVATSSFTLSNSWVATDANNNQPVIGSTPDHTAGPTATP